MWYWNKLLITSILLGILFSILFASADDAKSDEEKSIVSIPLIQSASAQQSSSPSGYIEQESYSGDCGERPSGTVCMGYSDGYVWLISDGKLAMENIQEDGNNVQIIVGFNAHYYHILDTNLVKTTPLIPRPVLSFITTEEYEASGNQYIRYHLTVDNWKSYPQYLFEKAPHLPPCGLNENAGRTWVDIFNGQTDARIYGFCAFTSPDDLIKLWFAVSATSTPPPSVYVKIIDRQVVGGTYTSNIVTFAEPEPEPATSSKSAYGELKVEKENYEISYSGTTLVKLFGTVGDSSIRGSKITFTITNPEGDREEFSVIPSKDGYFENYLPFDRYSLLGIYEVRAFTSEEFFIGKISFQTYDKNNPIVSTTKEPAPEPVEAPASTGPQTVNVSIPQGTSVPGCEETNECFMPSFISINVGDTVIWTNDDTAPHTLTSGTVWASPDLTFRVSPDGRGVGVATGSTGVRPDGIFDTFLGFEGDTFSFTFDKEGTYPYYSGVWQTGCVIVGRGDTICPATEPAPELDPSSSFSEGMKLFEEILSASGICEGLLSVDEVKTAIGYAGELESFFMTLPPNPKDPALENVCAASFFKPLVKESAIVFTLFAYDSAEPAIEKFTTMSQNMSKSSTLEMKEDVSETGWKYISIENKEGLVKESGLTSMILSQMDKYAVMVGGAQSEGDDLPTNLPQLHEVTKIVWEKMDEKISTVSEPVKEIVPSWIKNNAKWWSEGQIGDSDFVSGIQFMIKEKIINIPDLPEQASETAEEKVPDWIKTNAGWWADGQISEDDFVNGIKYLVEQGIIKV